MREMKQLMKSQVLKKLMAKKRCLIIADSFYEWQQDAQQKQPKRIQVKDRELFAFAGLWDKWEYAGKKTVYMYDVNYRGK